VRKAVGMKEEANMVNRLVKACLNVSILIQEAPG
jgi:hypothetical protein